MMLTLFKNHLVYCLILLGISLQTSNLYGQNNDSKEKEIKGLDFGILPSFVYNSDRGLQYGALGTFYYYGKGTKYPDYLYNLYLQCSQTTRRDYVNYLFFDSGHLLPKEMRLTINMSLLKRGYEHFYGVNGYNSLYNINYTDPTNPQFISRHYYFFEERTKTISMDLKGKFFVPHLQWDLGLGYYNLSTLPFRNRLYLGHRETTLFQKYIDQGVIPQDQRNGGVSSFFKTGLIYDTRNDESVPTKGIWIEGVYLNAPQLMFNKLAYSQITFVFHQYLPLSPKLVFAYRLAYQTKISGQIPIYMLHELASTYHAEEALGGYKTIRGILNRRLLGNGFALSNFEFRYIPIHKALLKRNLGIGFNFFEDMGMITDEYKVDPSLNELAFDYQPGLEKLHFSAGIGIRFIVNHNFIVAIDYGRAFDKRDGTRSEYIALDYLF